MRERQREHIVKYTRWTEAPGNPEGDRLFLVWDSTGHEPPYAPNNVAWQRYIALREAKSRRGATISMYREGYFSKDGSWIGGVNFFLPRTYGPATAAVVDGLIEAFGLEKVVDWFLAALAAAGVGHEY